jgi:MerR family transcriptional regulator/heat shock protein HspR
MYTDEDLERLEVILQLTRELGVNLAGVEIILNMREKMSAMQQQIEQFVAGLNHELSKNLRPSEGESKHSLIRVARVETVAAVEMPEPAPKANRAKTR